MSKRIFVRTTLEAGVFTAWMLMMLCFALSIVGCQPAQSLKAARSHYALALSLEQAQQTQPAVQAYRAALRTLNAVDTQAWQRDGLVTPRGLLSALCHWRLNEPGHARQEARDALVLADPNRERRAVAWLHALVTQIDIEQLAWQIEQPAPTQHTVADVHEQLFDPASGHMTRLRELMHDTDRNEAEVQRFLLHARLTGWHAYRRALHRLPIPPMSFSVDDHASMRADLKSLQDLDAAGARAWAERFGVLLDPHRVSE